MCACVCAYVCVCMCCVCVCMCVSLCDTCTLEKGFHVWVGSLACLAVNIIATLSLLIVVRLGHCKVCIGLSVIVFTSNCSHVPMSSSNTLYTHIHSCTYTHKAHTCIHTMCVYMYMYVHVCVCCVLSAHGNT